MASSDVEKVPVWDTRLAPTKPAYAVRLGAASVTSTQFQALSQTSSQHTYAINVPSLGTYVDRYVQWQSTVCVQVMLQFNNAPAATQPLLGGAAGLAVALAAYPLHRLTSNITASINDSTVSFNSAQCLLPALRMLDSKEGRRAATTPSKLDVFQFAPQGLSQNLSGTQPAWSYAANPYSTITDTPYGDDPGNGAFPFVFAAADGTPVATTGTLAAPTPVTTSFGGSPFTVNYVNGIPMGDGTNVKYPVQLRFTVTENLLIPPFMAGAPAATYSECMSGISNINLTMQMQQPAVGRIVRALGIPGITSGNTEAPFILGLNYFTQTASGSPFSGSYINMMFYTPPVTLPLPLRSVVPFTEWFAYPFNTTNSITPFNYGASVASQTQTIRSNTVTLSQIPDLIVVRVTPSQYTGFLTDADWCLPIQSVSVTLDNQSGLLSTMTQEQLYRMSYNNGLKMPYNQWRGYAVSGASISNAVNPSYANAGLASQALGTYTMMSGGELVLAPGRDIQLFPGLSAGCAGNFSFAISLQILNNYGASVTPTITIIAVNSGFFQSVRGQSSRTTTPLTETDVLEASKQDAGVALTTTSLSRMVGGALHSFHHHLGNVVSELKHRMSKPTEKGGLGAHSGGAAGGGLTSGVSGGEGGSGGAGHKRSRLEGRLK